MDQLWQQLPVRQRQAIEATLAQMIAQQLAAMHSLPIEEESDD